MAMHRLKIISLDDGLAECECGGWTYSFPLRRTQSEIMEAYSKHMGFTEGEMKIIATHIQDRQFQQELVALLNKCSRENASNTPDFILADYLLDCLKAFELAVSARTGWFKKG